MKRPFKFSIKQYHNIMTMTLIQNPLIILCTHKPVPSSYDANQYLPYEKWDECLSHYVEFLTTNHIPYTEYDFLTAGSKYIDHIFNIHTRFNVQMDWWREQWKAGYGCAGSPTPRYLLVAERIGPNNIHNIPFETGPTGLMLSSMLMETKTPLGVLAITNMVKSFRRDSRDVNDHDLELFEQELTHLNPKKVIFMGSVAKKGIALAKAHGCEVGKIVHLGNLNYRGVTDMSTYNNDWAKHINLVPSVSFKEV